MPNNIPVVTASFNSVNTWQNFNKEVASSINIYNSSEAFD